MLRLVAAMFLLAIYGSFAAQQQASASLEGTVTTTAGYVIPGGEVRIKNDATGEEVRAVTEERGTFSISLNPGSYTVSISVPGFQLAVIKEIVIGASTVNTIRVALSFCSPTVLLNGKPVSQSQILPAPLPSQNNPPEAYNVPEAYGVYAAILPSEWAWRVANAKKLIVRREIQTYCMCLQPEGESKKVMDPAIADWLRLSQTKWLLQKNLQIEKPYEMVAAADIQSIFDQTKAGILDGWTAFNEKYPGSGGYIELSAVGFNNEKTVAIVYVGHHCGSLCGGGVFHVLQKTEGKWQPLQWKGRRCSWQS